MGRLKKLIDTVCIFQARSEYNETVLRAFEACARYYYCNASPCLEFLPILTQFHFTRALITNIEVIGLSENQMHDDALSPFNTTGPWAAPMASKLESLPYALRPTDLQATILHHPWIDLIPLPQFRDNILKGLLENLDEDLLCQALSSRTRSRPPGIIVWQDPWDQNGWEITEAFIQSPYGWLLDNCWTLFESTNRWRASRGERLLFPCFPGGTV